MNQILIFQLDSISLNAGIPENSGIAWAGESKSVRYSGGKAISY